MNGGGRDFMDVVEQTQEAWSKAWHQMVETGAKAIQSSAFLVDTSDEAVAIAETPSDVIFTIDKVTLSRYQPLSGVEPADLPPVIICYGLFGRQTMIDLQTDRSLVRNLLSEGVDVYVIDWGTASRADQYLTFDDYVDYYLDECINHVTISTGRKVNLFGICEGGTFSAAYAALRPERLAGLALAITPIDFHGEPDTFWAGEGFLNAWIGNMREEDIDLTLDTYGMLPGTLTGAMFSSLTPIASMTKYNIGLAAMEGNEAAMLNFLRMEKWIADRPDHPGAAAKQWLNDLYRENQLVEGTFKIAGETVDLSKIECPVINIFAMKDHIIPISCSKALGKFVAKDLYEEIGFPGGHVGVFVSRKAQGVVAGGLVDWMKRRASPQEVQQSSQRKPQEKTTAKPVRKRTVKSKTTTPAK